LKGSLGLSRERLEQFSEPSFFTGSASDLDGDLIELVFQATKGRGENLMMFGLFNEFEFVREVFPQRPMLYESLRYCFCAKIGFS
jgi:hypothetical protein